jgi:hypothetical protein
MVKRAWYLCAVCAIAAAIAPAVAFSDEIIPADSTDDVWIYQKNNVVNDHDGLWTAAPGAADASTERIAVVQFNISSFADPITTARLELTPNSGAGAQLAPAAWVDSTVLGGPPASLTTYDDYSTFVQPYETQFELLGGGNFSTAAAPNGSYHATDPATNSDLATLNSIRTGDGIITMIFRAASGAREFKDGPGGYYGEFPVKLVLNEGPLPGDLNGDLMILADDYDIFKGNWRQTVPVGTGGDFNGDATVTLADFVQFKIYYDAFNGAGSSDALSPVPEPATLALLLTALAPALLWIRLRAKARS